jgi:hypothetical protein
MQKKSTESWKTESFLQGQKTDGFLPEVDPMHTAQAGVAEELLEMAPVGLGRAFHGGHVPSRRVVEQAHRMGAENAAG